MENFDPPPLKTHPLRYLAAAAVGVGVFALIAWLVVHDTAIVRFDRQVAVDAYEYTRDRPGVEAFFATVTDLGWGRLLTGVGAVVVLVLIMRREFFRAAAWGCLLLAVHEVVPAVKDLFERARPGLGDATGWSFPSGHSFGAAAVWGLVGLLFLRIGRCRRWSWVAATLFWSLIPLVALSRVMLGVHFTSDVVAGVVAGIAWGCLGAAVADLWDRRRAR